MLCAGPPTTAEEYLRRVRAEAAACPQVGPWQSFFPGVVL